ncbi:hypothetical protein EYZ11_002552 [Aspergillus tanneri]|uniref:Uncharacterized protein n=1 Tax=Aspergillus tanneri TaxID=1220188 RepID=A0A4S3JQN8_9EURO|nr:hypothetical protein EYZ11_002552 [Aspergillus tanneri]
MSSGFGRELAITAVLNHDRVITASHGPSKLSDLERDFGIIPQRLNIASAAEIQSAVDTIAAQFDTNVFRPDVCHPRRRGNQASSRTLAPQLGDREPRHGLLLCSQGGRSHVPKSLKAELAPFGVDIVCTEPGHYSTNLLTGGHMVIAGTRTDELRVSTQVMHDALEAYSLRQPGDPVKGTQVIF